jgi:flagellar basal-body rod protein FlgC
VFSDKYSETGLAGVDAVEVVPLDRKPELIYAPGHPNADEQGYVYKAPVNSDEEMVDMLEASRQYQNNLEVISTVRTLMMRTINMGK